MGALVSAFFDAAMEYHGPGGSGPDATEVTYGACLEDAAALAGTAAGFGELALRFLVDWGGSSTARAFPESGRARLRRSLDKWAQANQPQIEALSTDALWSGSLHALGPSVCDLFDTLSRVEQPRTGGKARTFGPTAAGKTLHLLLPRLCLIWDETAVRTPLGLGPDPWSYLRYLRVQKTLLGEMLTTISSAEGFSTADAVRSIVRTHRKQRDAGTPMAHDEPVTKLLDEAIYSGSFRKRWVAPLIEDTKLPW